MNCEHCDEPLRAFRRRKDFDARKLHLKCWKILQRLKALELFSRALNN